MTFLTWLRFLCGHKQASRDIAHCPQALWLGLLFVLSAGIAREYDGEDLLHEPYFLLIPPLASLLTSFVLYWVARTLVGRVPEGCGTQPIGYRGFLACYWMTGPLAWIYALPVERWMSDGDAMNSNLWFFTFVALWRVILMVRVVKTLFATTTHLACCAVVFFAFSIFAVVSWNMRIPILYMMGGVRLTDSETQILGALLLARIATILGIPLVAVWYLAALWFRRRADRVAIREFSADPTSGDVSAVASTTETAALSRNSGNVCLLISRVSLSLWMFATSFYLVGAWLLAWAQPEQQLRSRVEDLLRADKLSEGLSIMSRHKPSDFPPHWRPPPRTAYGEKKPASWKVLETALNEQSAPWVTDIVRDRFFSDLGDSYWSVRTYLHLFSNTEEVVRFLKFVDTQSFTGVLPHGDLDRGVERYLQEIEFSQEPSQQASPEAIDWLYQYVERGRKKREATPAPDNADPMPVD